MAKKDKTMILEAIRCAGGIHIAQIGANIPAEDVVSLAEKIYKFLTK